MPRKAKDKNEVKDKIEEVVSNIKSRIKKNEDSKKSVAKKGTTKKKTTKQETAKTEAIKKTATKKSTKTEKSTKNSKVDTTKKTTSAKTTKKTPKKVTTKSVKEPTSIMEYYDLPYRYNQTVVKILAQTPKMLFVYWDISDKDRENYKEYYGEAFFSNSRPVLIIHNETMNYSFELEINDFANSWYIHVSDANCKYNVELGRRPNRYISNLTENYVYISSSNELDAPNDHIMFETASPSVRYRNIKNNQISIKDFSNSAFAKKIMKIYSVKTIEELYEKLYSEELLEDFKNGYYKNPSSNPSSNFR